MGIRFLCHACEHRLNVKSFLAGKRGVCPNCGAKVEIPTESQIPSRKEMERAQAAEAKAGTAAKAEAGAKAGAAAKAKVGAGAEDKSVATPKAKASRPAAESGSSKSAATGSPVPRAVAVAESDALSEAPEAVWYVRPSSGGQFGPASADIMRRWIAEGRVSGDSMVWREGWEDWKVAAPVFPTLQSATNEPVDTPSLADMTPMMDDASVSLNGKNNQANNNAALRLQPRRKKSRSVALAIVITLITLTVGLMVALVVVLSRQN